MLLTPEDVKLHYRLHWGVMAYTNRCLKLVPDAITPDKVRSLSTAEKMDIREALYGDLSVLERFVAENPENLSSDELAIVGGWQYLVSGDFYIFRYLKKYAVFLSATEPSHLYGVLGLTETFDDVFYGRPLPILVKTVLLPFKGQITYDGLLSTYNVFFGGGVRSSLKNTYNKLKAREGITEQLVGLDGKPETRTSLDREKPRKPPPDWRPVVDEIVTQVEQVKRTNTPAQGAAASLLRAAAKLAQATLHRPDEAEDHLKQLSSVRRALTKLENLLYDDLYGE